MRRVAGQKAEIRSLEEVEEKIESTVDEIGIYGNYINKVEEIIRKYLKDVLKDGEQREIELEICTNNCGQVCCTKYWYIAVKEDGEAYLEFEDMEREPCWTRASPASEEYDEWNWCGVYSVSLRLF